MEIFYVFIFAAAMALIIGLVAYVSGRDAGIASVPAPPVKEYLDQNDFPETDPVVFGKYCMMEHQPWELR
jgi:hypothetical protein